MEQVAKRARGTEDSHRVPYVFSIPRDVLRSLILSAMEEQDLFHLRQVCRWFYQHVEIELCKRASVLSGGLSAEPFLLPAWRRFQALFGELTMSRFNMAALRDIVLLPSHIMEQTKHWTLKKLFLDASFYHGGAFLWKTRLDEIRLKMNVEKDVSEERRKMLLQVWLRDAMIPRFVLQPRAARVIERYEQFGDVHGHEVQLVLANAKILWQLEMKK